MREHGQHGGERAKACCEEDEERKLFLRVDGHLVEGWETGKGNYNLYNGQEQTSGAWRTHTAGAPCLLFLYILGRGKISDLSLAGRGLTGMLESQRHAAK